jgi:DNA-binding NtrC family response regulator
MTILIADDDKSIIVALELLLNSNDIDTVTAKSPAEIIEAIDRHDIELVIMDMNYCKDTTSGMEGLDLISTLRARDENLPVVAMTGWGTIQLAVEAMRRGANDFIEKPWDNNRLIAIVENQRKLHRAMSETRLLRAENALLRASESSVSFSSQSGTMKQLYDHALKFAASDMDILITGENGTGKSQLVKEIHQHSPRSEGPLIVVDMGSLSEGTFESEMFGHRKGAFTDAKSDHIGRIEMSNTGTLFLDEIGNTPLKLQSKLLHVLEEKEFTPVGSGRSKKVDFRVIAATNADLDELVESKLFRQDLLYRINNLTLEVPPLRKRVEDIPLLVEAFVQQASRKNGKSVAGVTPEAEHALCQYQWPGNIRELRHLIERAVILTNGTEIGMEDLQINNQADAPVSSDIPFDGMTLSEAEKYLIESALRKHQGNAINAARALGLTRSSFYRRLDKFGIKA